MSSYFERCAADAPSKRGYHASGVTILRPSTSVTTSSVAVNSTARGFRSPTSSSKVLIPRARQQIAILSQMADDIADFVRREPGIDGHRNIVKPKLGLLLTRSDVNMRGFIV